MMSELPNFSSSRRTVLILMLPKIAEGNGSCPSSWLAARGCQSWEARDIPLLPRLGWPENGARSDFCQIKP